MSGNEGFVALVMYSTTPAAQQGQAETLVKMAQDEIRSMPGFVSGRVFVSEDGAHIVTLVEWRDRESFVAFRQTEFGRAGAQMMGELHPTPYWLKPFAAVDPQ